MASPSSVASALLICMTAFSELTLLASAGWPESCPIESFPFLCSLMAWCSTSITPSLPLQDLRLLGLHAELLYSCTEISLPIMGKVKFFCHGKGFLGASSETCVLSRYGIHSLPSILVVNQTSMVKYHGSKTLLSLVRFYERNTGLEPVLDSMEDQLKGLSSSKESSSTYWNRNGRTSMKEMIMKDPFLSLSVLFLCLRVLRFLESLRVLNMIYVRRAWRKLRPCKSSNFHVSGRNAQVWAS